MQAFPRPVPAPDPQAEIRLLRENLLGGRGPGATPLEVAAHTRWRREPAGSAVPVRVQATRERATPPSVLTVVLFAVLLVAARRLLRRAPAGRGGTQMPARAA